MDIWVKRTVTFKIIFMKAGLNYSLNQLKETFRMGIEESDNRIN